MNRKRGFTLLELVIVLILLGTIMAFVAPRIFGNLDRANQQATKVKMEQLSGQLEVMRLEVGRYPTTQEGLRSMIEKPASMDRWNGPYVKDAMMLKDAWGNDFQYASPGQNKPFDLKSFGADGREGGDGPNADITN
ncbi:MAG: type II secretion system major pseudopilin GspG [Bacillota bacterium]